MHFPSHERIRSSSATSAKSFGRGGGSFVVDEVRTADEGNGKPVQRRSLAAREGLVSGHSADRRQQVDAVGRSTELDDLPRAGEIRGSKRQIRESEIPKSRHHSLGVGFRWTHQEIDVTGEPRTAMKGDRKTADDQVLNAVRIETFDKLSQILLKSRVHHVTRSGRAGSEDAPRP